MPTNVLLFFIPVFIVIFVVAVIGLHNKGWRNLQERYLFTSNDFNGEKVNIRKITIEGVGYQNMVRIKTSANGMYMRNSFPISFISKPLMIPWSEITDVQDKKALFGKYKRLVVGKPFASTIDLSEKDYMKLGWSEQGGKFRFLR